MREERLKAGLKQEEFAALGDASLNSQTRYETGQAAPKLEYLLKLGELKNVDVDVGYIVTGRRRDDSLGQGQRWLIDLYEALDPLQREALMGFLMAFAAPIIEGDGDFDGRK